MRALHVVSKLRWVRNGGRESTVVLSIVHPMLRGVRVVGRMDKSPTKLLAKVR